jgi:putative endonuclease
MWPARLSGKQQQGRAGEQRALAHLQAHGLRLVEANFHCKCGEIDLILQDGDEIVFVEVRQRAGKACGTAAASITPAKIGRIIRAAQFWLMRCPQMPPCRIDVVAIDGGRLEWLKGAIHV